MKFTLHPLFIALGLLSAVFGGFPVFIIYALTALLHECGHAFCAARLGFRCERISLMPYGAAAVCDTEGISALDEIKLALAGPAVNALICVFCAGLWWFFPVTYAFTDTVFNASAVMFAINLLPAYPLDGGRAAGCLLTRFLSNRAADMTLRISGVLFACLLAVAAFTLFKNFSLLVFAGFLVCSTFERKTPVSRIGVTAKKPRRGKDIKHVMLNAESTYKDALRHLDSGKYVIFTFYTDGEVDEIYEDELLGMLQTHSIYDKIRA